MQLKEISSCLSLGITIRHIKNVQERPIVTEEIETQLLKMTKQYQLEFKLEEDFQRQKENLSLQINE